MRTIVPLQHPGGCIYSARDIQDAFRFSKHLSKVILVWDVFVSETIKKACWGKLFPITNNDDLLAPRNRPERILRF